MERILYMAILSPEKAKRINLDSSGFHVNISLTYFLVHEQVVIEKYNPRIV